ncbi:hypothetical protein C8Q77DRAFT_410367 [Trametes polyzona]|nr:hypothetical protein C8Q77DRAFT_410367 [Trametes polyzona]
MRERGAWRLHQAEGRGAEVVVGPRARARGWRMNSTCMQLAYTCRFARPLTKGIRDVQYTGMYWRAGTNTRTIKNDQGGCVRRVGVGGPGRDYYSVKLTVLLTDAPIPGRRGDERGSVQYDMHMRRKRGPFGRNAGALYSEVRRSGKGVGMKCADPAGEYEGKGMTTCASRARQPARESGEREDRTMMMMMTTKVHAGDRRNPMDERP